MSDENVVLEEATGVSVNVSSYMKGNRLETVTATTVADILQDQGINTTECQIDVQDAHGNDKPGRASTRLSTGDTVQIMRKTNKSGGRRTQTIVTEVTGVSSTHPIPDAAELITRPRVKYHFHELKKNQHFDVRFKPRTEKEQKAVMMRVSAAKSYFRKKFPQRHFVTKLLTTKPSRNGSPTHLIRVWRSK